jgi:sporulation protein YlmC with PRC-barrel domain
VSDRFTSAQGRKVVSRGSAEELGTVSHLVVNGEQRRIVTVVVGKRRKARLVDWPDVSGFGPDAIMVADEKTLREPKDERDQAAASGKLELLGRRALSDLGNRLGEVTDVTFDPDTGAVETILVGKDEHPAASLLGAGSFAVILHLGDDETP